MDEYKRPPHPIDPPYYLTAYGIAVKHGFRGSEEEWLESLGGIPGEDGFSPEVDISKQDGVTTLTITDKNGQHTAEIHDGENSPLDVEKVVEDKLSGEMERAKAELKVTTDAISAEVDSVKESEKRLEERTGKLEVAADGIDAKVEKTVTDKVTGAVEDAKAELKVTTDAISQEVSSMKKDASGMEKRVGALETSVEGIDATVERTVESKVSGEVEKAKAELKITTDAISEELSSVKEDAKSLEERTAQLETTVDGITLDVEQTVTDKVDSAVEQATAEFRATLDGISQKVTKTEESAEGLETRVGSLETTVGGIDAKVEQTVENKVTGAVESATAELREQVEGLDATIDAKVASAVEGKVPGIVEEATAELQLKVDGMEAEIDAKVESAVSDAVSGEMESAKAELKVTTDAISQEVEAVKKSAEGLEERTATLETTVEGLDFDVEQTVTDKVSGAVESATAELKATTEEISQEVSSMKEDATGIETRVGALETSVGGIDAKVEKAVTDKVSGAVESATAELKATTEEISQEVSSMKEDATGIETRVGALETSVSGIDAKVESTVENKVTGAVDSAKAELREEIDGLEASITASVESSVEDKVSGAVDSAKAELELETGKITQRVESLEESTGGLETKAAEIETKVDGIKLEVTQSAGGDGSVTAKITLKVGPNSYSGYIQMDGNLDVSGQLSADALYAALGDVAQLTVDRFSTSRRIPLYLKKDNSDDNYVRAQDQYIEFVTGTTDGSTEQARTPTGSPLYWEDDPAGSGVSLGTDGYPYKGGQRIFTTTQRTSWPVMVYVYTEAVKRKIGFEMMDGVYTPVDYFGAGSPTGGQRGRLIKREGGMELIYKTSTSKGQQEVGVTMDDDGHLDLLGLRKTAALDFSGWDSGTFSETLEGEDLIHRYTVSKDSQGRPVSITDDAGHVTTIKW